VTRESDGRCAELRCHVVTGMYMRRDVAFIRWSSPSHDAEYVRPTMITQPAVGASIRRYGVAGACVALRGHR